MRHSLHVLLAVMKAKIIYYRDAKRNGVQIRVIPTKFHFNFLLWKEIPQKKYPGYRNSISCPRSGVQPLRNGSEIIIRIKTTRKCVLGVCISASWYSVLRQIFQTLSMYPHFPVAILISVFILIVFIFPLMFKTNTAEKIQIITNR